MCRSTPSFVKISWLLKFGKRTHTHKQTDIFSLIKRNIMIKTKLRFRVHCRCSRIADSFMNFQIIIIIICCCFVFYLLGFQITKPDICLQTLCAWNFGIYLSCLLFLWTARFIETKGLQQVTAEQAGSTINTSDLWERCPTSVYAVTPIILTYVVSYFSSAPPRIYWDNTLS
jgi:hypothetical protein